MQRTRSVTAGHGVCCQQGKDIVKLVIAIIQPTKLSAVREALEKIEVARMTITDAQGFGRQRGRTEMYRGHEYTTQLLAQGGAGNNRQRRFLGADLKHDY